MVHQRRRIGLTAAILAFAAGPLVPPFTRANEQGDATQALTATYDPAFGAPSCRDPGSSCQTDDAMIAGVAGFEPNFPNTVDNCTDSSNAVSGRDEYINRIIVRSKGGGTMKAGSALEIHVTIDKAVDVSSRSKTDAKETVHIYYASESLGETSVVT